MEYIYKTKPYQHQRDILEHCSRLPYWGFFCEPGTGKTKMLLDNASYLYEISEIKALVLSTTKGMCPTMELVEIPTHVPDRINYKVFRYNSAKAVNKQFKRDWATFLEFDGFKIFVFNTESAISVKLTEMMRQLYSVVGKNYMHGVDESSMIKTHTAKRSKAIVKFCRAAKYRRLLTGTPITNGPLELFGQAMALAPTEEVLGHKSFYSFRNYFADVEKKTFGNRSFDVVTGYKNKSELSDLISTFASVVKKEDALDLPEKIYQRVAVEMTKLQSAKYEKLKQEAIIELEELGDTVEVTNILTLLVKLHQIVCGQLKYEDDFGNEKYASIENNRLPTLMDLIENESGNVVVWATYRQTLRDVAAEIVAKYGKESLIEFHGGVSSAKKEVAAKNFQDPSHPGRFFVANPQSAGMGLTLTTADLAIYYSNDYSLERRIQSEDRIHRIGQKRKARYIDLFTPGTIDEKILNALKTKKKLVDEVVVSNWKGFFQ